jgi:hypothetical protein
MMEFLAIGIGVIMTLVAIVGLVWGVGFALVHVVFFIKALLDRINNKDDDHYSKNIHQ